MFVFPSMLVPSARQAGIKTPPDPDDYNADEYNKFHMFCCAQLGNPMPYPGVHFENAKVIARLKEDELENMTMGDLEKAGFQIGYSK